MQPRNQNAMPKYNTDAWPFIRLSNLKSIASVSLVSSTGLAAPAGPVVVVVVVAVVESLRGGKRRSTGSWLP